MSVEENKAAMRRFLEAAVLHARGEAEHIHDHLAPGVVIHTEFSLPGPGDADRLHDEVQRYGSALPDIDLEIDEILGEGDLVAAHVSVVGTHHGTFEHPAEAVEGTGARVEGGVMVLCRFRDGKVAELWSYASLADRIRDSAGAD
jgi:predicted ester cyclase